MASSAIVALATMKCLDTFYQTTQYYKLRSVHCSEHLHQNWVDCILKCNPQFVYPSILTVCNKMILLYDLENGQFAV